MRALAQLRIYRFDPGAAFEGQVLGAIERMQIGGDAKLLDALFVGRDAAEAVAPAVPVYASALVLPVQGSGCCSFVAPVAG